MDFKYEALPKYCLICGIMGHATRVCKEFLDMDRVGGTYSGGLEDNLVYRGLDVETDLRGNPLQSGLRSRGFVGSNGGQCGPMRWREKQSDEPDGSLRDVRSSVVVGLRGNANSGSKGSLSGDHSAARGKMNSLMLVVYVSIRIKVLLLPIQFNIREWKKKRRGGIRRWFMMRG